MKTSARVLLCIRTGPICTRVSYLCIGRVRRRAICTRFIYLCAAVYTLQVCEYHPAGKTHARQCKGSIGMRQPAAAL